MKTATLTILSRLLAMALGALGLGAFVALPASAQEIPAPDLFDGQVACSMNVDAPPATQVGRNADGDRIGITAKIHSNMEIAVTDGVPSGADEDLASIVYITDPNYGNCGAGTYTAKEAADIEGVEEGDPKPVAAGVAADVGAGYTDTLAKYDAAVEADGAVKTAQDALDAYLKDDIADSTQTTEIEMAQETLNDALAAQATANAALDATGAGPINMAGIAEWRAKATVDAAVEAWNTAVGGADDALDDLNPTEYAAYVPLGNDKQIDDLVDDSGNVNVANLRLYANAEGDNSSTQDAMGKITGNGNFDAAGNLLVPMEEYDHDNDATTDPRLRPVAVSDSFEDINARLNSVNDTVAALEKYQGENKNRLLDEVITEAIRRAKVEQAHYQGQFDAMVADITDLNVDGDGDPETMPDSLKLRHQAYTAAVTKRDNAGVTLETAVQTREAATAAVQTAFTSPQSFYQQLVDRRSLLKAEADAEVTRLAGLTGDEAPTQTAIDNAATAASNAQTALDDALEIQASFQDIIGEDSPVAALVLETLKPDSGAGAGDDGGVLVATIDDAFDAAAEAKTAADNAVAATTEAGNAVAALTAEDDPDTPDVDETGAVTKNANDIADLQTDLEGLTGDSGQVSQNTTDIERIDGVSVANEEAIADLGGRVTANEMEIGMDEDGMSRIDHNEAGVAANSMAIGVNAGNISTNAENIGTNATNIMANAGNIATNAGAIATNAADIMTNAGNIAMNNSYIMANSGMIEANAGMIGANASAIGANTAAIAAANSRIDANAMAVRELREDMSGGIAAAMALAGMPEIGDRGVSIGAGSYDGESAVAVGVHFSGESSRFKAAITSGGGETGVSVGAGWSF